MHEFIFFVFAVVVVILLLGIRSKLSRQVSDERALKIPPSFEGFEMLVTSFTEEDYEFGWDGNWRFGTAVSLYGDIRHYHDVHRNRQTLKYGDTMLVTIHPKMETLHSNRIGNVWVREGEIMSVNIFMPLEMVRHLIEDLREGARPIVEVDIAQDPKPNYKGEPTYGAYFLRMKLRPS